MHLINKALLLVGQPKALFSKIIEYVWREYLARTAFIKYLVRTAFNTGLFERWFFNVCAKPEVKQLLGYKVTKELLTQKQKFHNALLKEQDPQKRMILSGEYYNNIFTNPLEDISLDPQNKIRNYGFIPDMIEKEKDLFREKIVVDFGCGAGPSTELISRYATYVYGVDCSSVIIEEAKKNFGHLENAQFLSLEKIELSLEDETIDVVYSNDLIEHLHPSDAFTHFQEVWRVLKKGGKYYFWTPGSRTGPHDFTSNFCPKGFGILSQASHIKEYDLNELMDILKMSKFSKAVTPDNKKDVLLIAEK